MKFTLIINKNKDEEVVATVHDRNSLTDEIESLVLQYTGADRIPAYTEDDMKMLAFADMECVTVLDGRTCAIDRNGKHYRLRLRLYELEEMLPSYFIRINKSTLANENRLDHFAPSFSGAVDAVFQCGYRDYVSRRCFAAIKRRYDKL